MRTIAILLAAALFAAAEDKTVFHSYDVSALTLKVTNFKGPGVGFDNSWLGSSSDMGGIGIGFSGGEEEGCALPGEDLKLLISQNVAPGTWDNPPNFIEYQDGSLQIRHTKEAHVEVKRFLQIMRSRLVRTIVIEGEVFELAPGAFEIPAGVLLSDEQVKSLDAAATDPAKCRRVASLRACALNGERVHAEALGQESYLRDYDIEIAQHAAIADPIVGTSNTGYVLDVRPAISPDGSAILLETRFSTAESLPMRTFVPGGKWLGVLEQPDQMVARTGTTLVVPTGRTALLSTTSFAGQKRGWTTVVTLRAGIQADAPEALPETKEKYQLRTYDVGTILFNARDFPGPRLGGVPVGGPSTGGSPSTTFIPPESENGIMVSGEQLETLLKSAVGQGNWDSGEVSIALTGTGQLIVVQTPENLKKVDEFVNRLALTRQRVVSVESWLVAMDDTAWRDRRGALSGDITDAAWNDVIAAANKGGAVRLAGSARTAGLDGTRFHSAIGTIRTAVLDYDVEIAQGAESLDPVMSNVAEGICLDVKPTMVGDAQVQLDLRPTTSLGGEPQIVTMREKETQIQSVAMSDFGVRTQMLMDAGRPSLVGISTRVEGGKTEVLLLFVRAAMFDVK